MNPPMVGNGAHVQPCDCSDRSLQPVSYAQSRTPLKERQYPNGVRYYHRIESPVRRKGSFGNVPDAWAHQYAGSGRNVEASASNSCRILAPAG
jgi:hypothetical protein